MSYPRGLVRPGRWPPRPRIASSFCRRLRAESNTRCTAFARPAVAKIREKSPELRRQPNRGCGLSHSSLEPFKFDRNGSKGTWKSVKSNSEFDPLVRNAILVKIRSNFWVTVDKPDLSPSPTSLGCSPLPSSPSRYPSKQHSTYQWQLNHRHGAAAHPPGSLYRQCRGPNPLPALSRSAPRASVLHIVLRPRLLPKLLPGCAPRRRSLPAPGLQHHGGGGVITGEV